VAFANALRLEPHATSPNLLCGYGGNWRTTGVYGAVIAGGGEASYRNRVTDNYGVVGGGRGNQAGDNAGTTADRAFATVAGGWGNRASGEYSLVGGGQGNVASGLNAAIGGGQLNGATSQDSTIGGGNDNTASGARATVPGGDSNEAAGDYSFAAGRRAHASNTGCFVWGDSTAADVSCTVNNRWVARASGGVYFYTNAGMSTGVYVAAGGGSWASVSDRNLKANVQPVDGRAVLEKLAAVPIATWNYVSQDAAIRHIGPMAQDFAAAFGVGEDDTHITTVDADGVALAAIQGLYTQNQALAAENTALRQQVDSLEARLTALEGAAGTSELGESCSPLAELFGPALVGAAVVVLAGGLGLAAGRRGRRG